MSLSVDQSQYEKTENYTKYPRFPSQCTLHDEAMHGTKASDEHIGIAFRLLRL